MSRVRKCIIAITTAICILAILISTFFAINHSSEISERTLFWIAMASMVSAVIIPVAYFILNLVLRKRYAQSPDYAETAQALERATLCVYLAYCFASDAVIALITMTNSMTGNFVPFDSGNAFQRGLFVAFCVLQLVVIVQLIRFKKNDDPIGVRTRRVFLFAAIFFPFPAVVAIWMPALGLIGEIYYSIAYGYSTHSPQATLSLYAFFLIWMLIPLSFLGSFILFLREKEPGKNDMTAESNEGDSQTREEKNSLSCITDRTEE